MIIAYPPEKSGSNTPIRFLPIPKPRGGQYRLIGKRDFIGNVGDFYMAETPITVGQWGKFKSFYKDRGDQIESTIRNHFGDNPNLPRESISWIGANDYCVAIKVDGYTCRLPTRHEWEWAALGGEDFKYAGCTNVDKVSWYQSNSNDHTQEVKGKKSNQYGLYDMIGNVLNWTSDFTPSNLHSIRVAFCCGANWSLPEYAVGMVHYQYGTWAIEQSPNPQAYYKIGFRPVLVVKS